ncbi:MAG: hypothetical protein HYT63_03575 [Candidatus Yanofskybacteria bacterium]|nr:hypothetical protein [Candidatus Yanofskybacteria bacterium]
MTKMCLLRVLIISLVFILLFFVGSSVSAQKMTIDPVLPKGFKDWPHKFEKSKKVNDKSTLTLNIYAKRKEGELNLLRTWSVNGQLVHSVFMESGTGLNGDEGGWSDQYWLGDASGYISWNWGVRSDPKDTIKFPTKDELDVIMSIFIGNIKNKFDFDFNEQVNEFDYDSDLKRLILETVQEEKSK